MNKISLKHLNLKEVEKLSREQLKSVMGGWSGSGGGSGGSGGSAYYKCVATCKDGYTRICTASEDQPGCTATDGVGCSGYHNDGNVYHNDC